MAHHDRWIGTAIGLFEGWSSGDPDAPERYFHPEGVLFDVASGRFEGWPAIREFFAAGLAKWDDLVLAPDEFWWNDTGLALHYEMSATIKTPDVYGPEMVGRVWKVEVMSYLRFEGDLVIYEADFHDKGARAKYLGPS